MSVVCEEVFDETSNPSIEEIHDYAKKIGIDPDSEPQLLPLAAEGLMKALPPGWRPCYDEASKSYYYHNNATGKTQWEHPLDDVYRGLVKKARTDSQSLSLGEPTEDATYIRDELPSFEEPFVAITKKDIKLSPLKKAPDTSLLKLMKQKSEERPLLNIDNELKVTGGGSIFLKSNTKKLNEEKQKGNFLSPETPPRSILRTGMMEPSRSMEFDKSAEKSDKEEDDKKSVRFNLENNTTDLGGPTFSDKSSSCSEEEEEEEKVEKESDHKQVIAVPKEVPVTKTKSRFTVSPVREDNVTNLKLIKPNPADFIKPKLKVSRSSDSDEDTLMKILGSKTLKHRTKNDIEEEIFEKTERKIEQLRNSIWEEKNDELRKFREDIQESHQKELERILIEEKSKHEENIKKELENLRVEMDNRTKGTLKEEKEKLEAIIEEKRHSLEEEYKKIEENLQEEFSLKKKSLERLHNEKVQQLEKDFNEKFDKQKDDLIVTHNATVDQLKHNHSVMIEDLKKEFKAQEEMLRKERQSQRAKEDKNIPGDERQYEKIRCEKRLLEDKYRCLKEKYLKLKTDVKLSIEKRNRKREQSGTATTTGSETERSHSINKERSPIHSASPHKPPTPKHSRKPEHRATRQIIIQDLDTSASDRSYKNEPNIDDSSDGDVNNSNKNRKKMFSRLKSSSTSRINSNKPRKTQRSCSPVENLRRQLQKLEDLEDQFPQNPQSDTYHLRYPFSDEKKVEGSSELEFFRHRIHLERDSIKRAKEGLRSQKSLFQQRQKELKLKHGSMARHTLQQLCQEEKELTDMEVSLHRTRSLLGEKVIRLRHLEQSLYRATLSTDQNKQDDTTLSDLSSHSASSGISSTEFATADGVSKAVIRGENFQESSEIIQSLENLNSEIREIWEVLHKQQQQSGSVAVMPPFPLVYPDLGWPVLAGTAAVPAPPSIPTLADRLHNYRQHVALANAQSTVVTHANQGATTTLVERTRNLRHWLRQAGIDNANEGTTPQATL